MQIKCVAIDDEPLALKLISEFALKFSFLKMINTFDDAIAGVEFLKNHTIDLLFIDINMPDISGIELVRSLKQKPAIIFTTAHKKFAIEGFELDALDYLLKPIDFERFSRAVNKALDYIQYKKSKTEKDEAFFVRSEYQLVKIVLNDIEYIESLEDYLKIHLTAAKAVMTLMTLKAILEKLPPDKFKRIHRSYIVSVSKIKSVLNRKVRLTSVELPLSDSYAAFINEWMKK
jgi:two-component system, LytTR family, response regulator